MLEIIFVKSTNLTNPFKDFNYFNCCTSVIHAIGYSIWGIAKW